MGRIITVECAACNLKDQLSLGAGRHDHRTHDRKPVACHDCGHVTAANAFQPPLACQSCGSRHVTGFDIPLGAAAPGQALALTWRDWCLPAGLHPCPRCESTALWFRGGGFFYD